LWLFGGMTWNTAKLLDFWHGPQFGPVNFNRGHSDCFLGGPLGPQITICLIHCTMLLPIESLSLAFNEVGWAYRHNFYTDSPRKFWIVQNNREDIQLLPYIYDAKSSGQACFPDQHVSLRSDGMANITKRNRIVWLGHWLGLGLSRGPKWGLGLTTDKIMSKYFTDYWQICKKNYGQMANFFTDYWQMANLFSVVAPSRHHHATGFYSFTLPNFTSFYEWTQVISIQLSF
jgi:hypothetical protein